MRRLIVSDRFDNKLFEIAEADVFELTRHEVVNGEHSLSITTTRVLESGWRILHEDDRGYWHEHVVYGIDSLHASGDRPIGTYYCVWSIQHDLMGTRVSAMPGTQTPVTAAQALLSVLEGTSRWVRGTVTNTATGGASMYDMDGWSAMAVLLNNWGGELDTTIEVGTSGITARDVDLYAQQGETTAKRRYDFGDDLRSVRRTIPDGPLYCRITPRGRGEETESGGYGRKITIESVNDGKDYLEYAPMVDLAKLPDGNGGWEYPTLEIENGDIELPSDLKAWAESVIEDCLVPQVVYEIDVVQLAREGIDLQGVSLGDAVHIVDRKFDLRISARVMELTVDEIAGRTQQLTIGGFNQSIGSRLESMSQQIAAVQSNVDTLGNSLSTADYIESLLDRINAEINATGGYAYIVPGNGILTFDVAVADPLNPIEASRVVEIKGGTIRIANSKTAQGQWEWKTVFTSGHVNAELVTAAQLVAGYIGSATSGTYWDLDNNLLNMGATTILDGSNLADSIEAAGLANTMVRAYGSGVLVCRQGNTVGALVNSNGSFDVVKVTWSGATPTASTVYSSFGTTATIGQSNSGRTVITDSTIDMYVKIGSSVIKTMALGGTKTELTIGGRASGTVGDHSTSIGYANVASNGYAVAIGNTVNATGQYSLAVNNNTTAGGTNSFASGSGTSASGSYSSAFGKSTIAAGTSQAVFGEWNVSSSTGGTTGYYMIVGKGGSSSTRADAMRVVRSGNMWIAGTLTQNSDRRLKQHVAYLGDDANVIIDRLKPAVFIKDGGRHYGFYAQDVQRADIWDTKTVESKHTDESLDFDPLTLDYTALIAPLTAYVQNLEKRVAELERRLNDAE